MSPGPFLFRGALLALLLALALPATVWATPTTLSPDSFSIDNETGQPVSTVVTLFDENDDPDTSQTETLTYSVSGANTVASTVVSFDENGQATVSYTPTSSGTDTIDLFVTSTPAVSSSIEVFNSHGSVSAFGAGGDPGTTHKAWASFFKPDGSPRGDVTVNWSRSGANGDDSGTLTTDAEGRTTDLTWAAPSSGTDTVEFWLDSTPNSTRDADEAYDTVNVASNYGFAFASGGTEAPQSQHTATAEFFLADGSPRADATIHYDRTGVNGSDSGILVTDSNGSAQLQWQAGPNVGDDTIVFWYDANSTGILDPGDVSDSTVVASAAGTMELERVSVSQARVTLLDLSSNPLSGRTVQWSTTAGQSGQVTTDGQGHAVITIAAGAVGNSVTLTANWFPPSSTTAVTASTSWGFVPFLQGSASALHYVTLQNFQCQADYGSDLGGEFFDSSSYPATCETLLNVDDQPFSGFSLSNYSQSGVSGAGTRSDPYRMTMSGTAGTTGIVMSSVSSLVPGDDYFRTDVTVRNTSGASHAVRIAQYADCYLQGSDDGYGYRDTSTGGVYCTANPNNSPAGRLEGFVPLSSGSRNIEAHYSTARSAATSPAGPDNTCICGTLDDNGMALSWDMTVPAGQTATRSFLTTFSPVGALPDITGPAVSVSPLPEGSTTTDPSPLLSGSAGTAPGDEQVVTVEIYSGSTIAGSPIQTFTASVVGGTWQARPPSPLAPGTYTARASQRDANGNVSFSAPWTFTVAAAQQPPPPQQVPAPTPRQTGNATPVSGTICVYLPKEHECTPLTDLRSIPVGSIIDARHGTVRLTVSDGHGGTYSGDFSGGLFRFTQNYEKVVKVRKKRKKKIKKITKELTTKLALRGGGNPRKLCPKGSDGRRKGTSAKRRYTRYLKAQAHGRFRVVGRRSSGIERGTAWKTTDSCSGTLTQVTSGAVFVTDFAKHKTVLVKAPHKYLATGKARGKRKRKR